MRISAQARDTFILCLIGAGIASLAVFASGDADRAVLIVAPLSIGLLAWFVLIRFELFTLVMIAIRTGIEVIPFSVSADLLRLSVLATGVFTAGAVFWLVRSRAEPRTRHSPLAWATAGVAVAASVSALLSSDPLQAGLGASRWIFLAVFVVVMERLTAVPRSIRVPWLENPVGFANAALVAVAMSMIVPLVMGAWQIATDLPSVIGGESRISGSLSHPNTFGFYLVIMILGTLAIAPRLPPVGRAAGSVLALVASIELAATYSRTSYLALAVGLMVLIVVGRRWLLLGVAVVVIVGAASIPGVSQRWADLDEQVTVRGTPANTLAWRIDYWESVLDVSSERRVTGLGLGLVSQTTEEEREPHNDFVRALAELGFIGLIAYTALLAVLVGRAVRGVWPGRPRGEPILEGVSEGFAALTAALLLASVTGNLMTQLVLLWYVLGFAVLSKARGGDRPRTIAVAGDDV